MVRNISSPTLGDTVKEILMSHYDHPGIRLLSLFLLEDANEGGWSEAWRIFISDKKITHFEVEAIIERLFEAVSFKALDEDQSKRFDEVALELEKRFDWSQAQAVTFRQSLVQTKNIQQMKDFGGKI